MFLISCRRVRGDILTEETVEEYVVVFVVCVGEGTG